MTQNAAAWQTDGWKFPVPGFQLGPDPACSVQCVATDGMLELSVAGLFAAREAVHLRHAILHHLRTRGAVRAFVIDLRKALVLLDGDGDIGGERDGLAWPQIDRCEARLLRKPMALVVAREVETRFLLWSWEMAAAGLARAAFVDRREARAWVQSRCRQD